MFEPNQDTPTIIRLPSLMLKTQARCSKYYPDLFPRPENIVQILVVLKTPDVAIYASGRHPEILGANITTQASSIELFQVLPESFSYPIGIRNNRPQVLSESHP